MRAGVKLLGVGLIICALAVSAAFAQTPPTPEPVPWDEAQLDWPAPLTFAGSGGSLADCATGPCGVLYIVEAKAPGGNGWGPIAVTEATTYRVRGLWAGLWEFRVKAFFRLTGYSPPGPIATKTVVEPLATQPIVTPPTGMTAR